MDFKKLASEQEQYMIEVRRYLHRHPELSTLEFETLKFIMGELDKIGVPYVEVENGGIIATIEGDKPGKTLLMRADIDALPVTESPENLKGPRDCISENPGVMHACGHDAHTAMLLGAAKILWASKSEIKGKILLVFERGEEGVGNMVYLMNYIDKNEIQIDGAWAIHMLATLDSGKISLTSGPVMAGGVSFDVVIKGKGGHSSRPDMSNNPLDCFNTIYTALQSICMRNISPYEPLTLSVCLVEGATKSNVIPETIRFSGGARVFDAEKTGMPFYYAVQRVIENICRAYDCDWEYISLRKPSPSVVNDADCCKLAEQAVTKALGAEYIQNEEPWMASEDFGVYIQLWPGLLAFVGIQNPEKGSGAAHHNDQFEMDDDVLVLGATSSVAYAFEFLEADIDTTPKKYPGRPMELLDKLRWPNTDFIDEVLGRTANN